MKNLNLRQLEAFRAVMVGKTITRAAELMFISQPAVTRLINDLESRIDFALFERRKKRLYPTPEAHALFEEVERTFSGLDKINIAAREIRDFRSGSLAIAALPALGLGYLPRVISEFTRGRPDVSVSFNIRSSQKVSELVATQRADVGFTESTDFDIGVEAELLLTARMVCILPAKHRLTAKKQLCAGDMDGEVFIGEGGWQLTSGDIDRYFSNQGVKRKIQIDTQLHASVADFVLAGAGISIVDPITADRFSQLGIEVRPFTPPLEYKFYVIYAEGRPRSRLVVQFVELLRERIASYQNYK
ncbi:MAG: LysR substrate-binding domain-containing protein [Gammaproteobacteria bacterium]|nr:LysR substrate-binding domain-containing protein [Gammaproteobacteria bacterium]MDH3447125.1 LysR substrate-binding domain-containing protein [Gammaproteobacteria bacterium]